MDRRTIEDKNPQIDQWNTQQASQRLAGLKFLRTLWVCAISGGQFEYTAQPLDQAHFEFHLKPDEFDAVAGLLSDTPDHFKVPEREKNEVLGGLPRTSRR